MKKRVIVIIGPDRSGKSYLANALAQDVRFNVIGMSLSKIEKLFNVNSKEPVLVLDNVSPRILPELIFVSYEQPMQVVLICNPLDKDMSFLTGTSINDKIFLFKSEPVLLVQATTKNHSLVTPTT